MIAGSLQTTKVINVKVYYVNSFLKLEIAGFRQKDLMPNKQVPSCTIKTVLCSIERQSNIYNTHKVRNFVSYDVEQISKILTSHGKYQTGKSRNVR